MCRFNLILIKEECAEKQLIQEGYQRFYDDLCGFKAYQKGYCNCGSLVGSFPSQKGIAYQVVIEEARKEKLNRLYQIRTMMKQPEYEQQKEDFQQVSTEYSDQLDTFYQHIYDYERNQSQFIHEQFKDEEAEHQFELMHDEISNMFLLVEEQPEFMKIRTAYHNYIKDNDLLQESLIYSLNGEDNNLSSNSIPLKELLNLDEDFEAEESNMITIPIESNAIDDVIERTENDTNAEMLEEYQTLHSLFTKLLKQVPSIRFGTIWSESNDLQTVKTVDINSLLIDDLAFLNYDEMICITK